MKEVNIDIDSALQTLVDFIAQETQEILDEQEKAIIVGCLAGLTYKDIKQQSAILRGLTVEFIARCLAYKLWKKLNQVINQSSKINKKIKVRKNQLWYIVEEIASLQITHQPLVKEFFPANLLEEKVLKSRYEITEYLFDRNSVERHYLAIDRDLGDRPCLVVQLLPESDSVNKRFEREAVILSQLGNHPQIPQLLAYFAEERYYYLIYEHIEGEPLTNLFLKDTPWQETEVKSLLLNLLPVLEFIQRKNVIHRNLNPDNIICSGDKLVLIDFATIKAINNPSNSISQTTFAQGMIGYMPAEQHMGITTFASDIYAVGKILIHALTGIHPLKLKINSQTANIIWRNHAQVSDRFAAIIDRAVCHNFPERYQSATEMLQSLNELAIV